MKIIKAIICTYVHHKGWCKHLHKQNECPFVNATRMILNPVIVIGDIKEAHIASNDMEAIGEAFNTPGSLINFSN